MGSQRFCLRWNNHQSNLLSVFDQLLHDEAFVDVTLAVEGQFLRAHKMVLSACSPYFQALFVGHPDKHPIVILKDVPYSDMRSLLDFMYRGEVSVDQDRLTAFLKVAESLRIKGLTEVNEERCDLPSIANSLLNQALPPPPPPPPPPPNLHRILLPQHKRHYFHQNAMLNSALTAPRRKRGRPRKLSGSSSGNPTDENDESKHNNVENHVDQLVIKSQGGAQQPEAMVQNDNTTREREGSPNEPIPLTSQSANASPQCLQNPAGNSSTASEGPVSDNQSPDDKMDINELPDDADSPEEGDETENFNTKVEEPKPSTSGQDSMSPFPSSGVPPHQEGGGERYSASGMDKMMRLVPQTEMYQQSTGDAESDSESLIVAHMGDVENNNEMAETEEKSNTFENTFGDFPEPASRPPPSRRRVRRRATSNTDPAEALTEMSVRGLNLFRYASITEGVYKCMECAKSDMIKTFKNKYSFQRHAFLYHEGHQRKVFPCPVCAKEFSRPDKMKNHMKMVHDCFMPKEVLFSNVGFYLPP
ncbi:protein tramtrack, alpha isoform isoform X3 [Cimex lectularius]|uniref:Tramtrack n=1 Tax=Cimex lectularius TaxID=79782 RepID=A0A8I6RHY0_CIMLE|nr:protein tramtrack, alpha isoform isoform X3 [Cimex lectularius]